MRVRAVIAALLAQVIACSEVCAEFVPGRLYIAGGVDYCVEGKKLEDDGIYEFDPLTGNWSIFATLPEGLCGMLGGMTFTPDYSRLRVSSYSRSSILEIDGDGNVSVALGPQDGIANPLGGNNLAYAPNGDFYVSDFTRILRFPADGGPGELFADFFDGVRRFGPLSIAPDGTVYFGPAGLQECEILRFTPAGEGSIFDILPEGHRLGALVVDDSGNVFASSIGGMYRYDDQDADTRRRLNDFGTDFRRAALVMSADNATVYQVTNNFVASIDAVSGDTSVLGFIGADFDVGYGMALYVPEPDGLALLAGPVLFGRWLRFRAIG